MPHNHFKRLLRRFLLRLHIRLKNAELFKFIDPLFVLWIRAMILFGFLFVAFPALTFGVEESFWAHSIPTEIESWIETDIGEKWFAYLMKREGFKNGMDVEAMTSISFSPFDPPGVNYGSKRTRVDMSLLLKSCKTVNTSVIVVAFPDNVARKKKIADAGLFDTDIKVYDRILPKMDIFLYERKHFAKRIWTSPIELMKYSKLVLHNIENMGYKRKNKREGLDMAHCRVAVEDLAKFHALSAVLQSKDVINVTDFDLSLSQKNSEKIGDWYGNVFKEFAKSIRAAWGPEWESAAQVIDEKSKTVTEDHLKLLKRDDSKLNALLNGGSYINNLFFNYGCSKDGSPKSSKLLNFQNAFWNTPALDLQLFLNTSPEPEIITDDTLRDKIVTYYATQLRAFLSLYGDKRNVSEDEIKAEIRRTELIGFINAVNHLSGMYLRPEDSLYTEKFIIDALKNKEIRIDSKGMILPRYIEVMKKLVTRAQSLGVI